MKKEKLTKIVIAVVVIGVIGVMYSELQRQNNINERELEYKQELENRKLDLKQQEIELEKKLEAQKKYQEYRREENLNNCLTRAYDIYSTDWNRVCEIINKDNDCTLPKYRADDLWKVMQNNKDNCYKQYK
ncbi:MAG: hypothetical protein P1P85_05495 [Patescibacteria group bacterium]|nr:hypothetical protein [Patescibacteria group bacterium]